METIKVNHSNATHRNTFSMLNRSARRVGLLCEEGFFFVVAYLLRSEGEPLRYSQEAGSESELSSREMAQSSYQERTQEAQIGGTTLALPLEILNPALHSS
jgi:hypothetical protein